MQFANSCHAVIVNYNSGQIVADCVISLLRSPAVIGITVVDNASTDSSMLRLERIAHAEPHLTLLRNRTNLGFARACNRALKRIRDTHVLFINPDCTVADGAVEAMLAELALNPDAAMVGPLLVNPDGTEQPGGRRSVPTPWRSFLRGFGLSRLNKRYPKIFSDFLLHREPLPPSAMPVEAISGACMLVRAEALRDVGPLDPEYFMHCEDLDWCMRFRREKWQVLFVPDAVVSHEKGVCSRDRPVFVEWHKHRGMIRFYKKFFRHQYPGALMWVVSGGVWLRFSLVTLLCLVKRFKPRGAWGKATPVSGSRGSFRAVSAGASVCQLSGAAGLWSDVTDSAPSPELRS